MSLIILVNVQLVLAGSLANKKQALMETWAFVLSTDIISISNCFCQLFNNMIIHSNGDSTFTQEIFTVPSAELSDPNEGIWYSLRLAMTWLANGSAPISGQVAVGRLVVNGVIPDWGTNLAVNPTNKTLFSSHEVLLKPGDVVNLNVFGGATWVAQVGVTKLLDEI